MGMLRGYVAPIVVRQTAASIAGTFVWVMQNTGLKEIFLRAIMANVLFDGTAAGSQSSYQFARFRGGQPSGGTSLAANIAPLNRLDKIGGVAVASTVGNIRFLDTGLTLNSAVADGSFASCGVQRQNTASSSYPFQFSPLGDSGYSARQFTLDPQDGLAILLGNAAVIGDGIQGYVQWDELGGPA